MEVALWAVRGIFLPKDQVFGKFEELERAENDSREALVCAPPTHVASYQYNLSCGVAVGVAIGTSSPFGYPFGAFRVDGPKSLLVEDGTKDVGEQISCPKSDTEIAALLTEWGFPCLPEDIATHIVAWWDS